MRLGLVLRIAFCLCVYGSFGELREAEWCQVEARVEEGRERERNEKRRTVRGGERVRLVENEEMLCYDAEVGVTTVPLDGESLWKVREERKGKRTQARC